MAISYVGGVQGGRAGSTSTTTQSLSGTLTGGSNTSPSAGDLVVVLCAAGGDGTGSPTSQTISGNNNGAYTALTFQSITTVTYDSFSQVNYIIQGGTVDTSITIPSSGNARNAQRWIVHVFRDVDSTTPLDVTATYATGTATGRPNPASINPSTAGAWICAFYASAAATGAAYTAPTDFATDWLGGTTADTADCMTGGGYYTGWASGSYDPAAITAGGTTGANDSWTATTIALRPAPPPALTVNKSESVTVTESVSALLDNSLSINKSESVTVSESRVVDRVLTINKSESITVSDVIGTIQSLHNLDFNVQDSGTSAAQGFTPLTSANVSSVSIVARKINSPTDNYYIEIRESNGSNPSDGTLLGTSDNVAASGFPASNNWVSFTFSSSVSLSQGTLYYIVIGRSGALDTTNNIVWRNWSSGSVYTGGTFWAIIGSWFELTGRDFTFNFPDDSMVVVETPGGGGGDLSINKSESVTVTESLQRHTENYINKSDTATLTESVQRQVENRISVSDSSTLTESLQREANNFINKSDTSTLTENVSIYQENYVINKSESVTVTENLLREVESYINKSDSITVTDTDTVEIGAQPDLDVNVNDTTTITEALQREVTNFIVKTENATVTESVNLLIPELLINTNETATVSESFAVVRVNADDINLLESENVTVTEAITLLIPELFATVSDSASVTESRKQEVESFVNKSDSITVTDTDNVILGNYTITVSDTTTLTENLKLEANNSVNVSDTTTVTENLQRQVENYIVKSDTATITESTKLETENRIAVFDVSVPTDSPTVSVQPTATPAITVNDTATLTENLTVLIPELLINKSENVTVTESVSAFIPTLHADKTDSATVSETVNLLIPELFLNVAESVSVGENLIVAQGNQAFYNINSTESVTVSESVTAEASAVLLNLTDNVTVSENLTVQRESAVDRNISVSDSTTLTESVTVQPPLVQINVSDTTTITDTPTVSIPTVTWSINVSDSISGAATQQRSYYIDSDGNIYWVINQSIGLVEKI